MIVSRTNIKYVIASPEGVWQSPKDLDHLKNGTFRTKIDGDCHVGLRPPRNDVIVWCVVGKSAAASGSSLSRNGSLNF